MPTLFDPERVRRLLLELGAHVRDRLSRARQEVDVARLSQVARLDVADTIYEIDRLSEAAIAAWFGAAWPEDLPAEIVMEGVPPSRPLTVPAGTAVADTGTKLILDPIDGTRGLMYDKRPAWFLAGAAPQRGPQTTLLDVEVAVMVELPTSKAWRSDAVSAVRGCGILASATDVFTGATQPLALRPSRATDFGHSFACFSRFFPAGKALTARLEEELWQGLGHLVPGHDVIFEDQYLSTGGQFYEILAGHDRMLADLRPLIHQACGWRGGLHCHPYDVIAELVLREAGAIVEKPLGGRLDAPLDTTSSVAWVAFANARLADLVRPVLRPLLLALRA